MDVSDKMPFECSIIFTPKFHCELAGEGIEYAWGMSKRLYRSRPLKLKRSAKTFNLQVQQCIADVSLQSARRFSAKARRYMMVYQHLRISNKQKIDDTEWSFDKIEKMNKVYRSHRDVNIIDGVFINEVIRDCIGIKQEQNIKIWSNTQANDDMGKATI